MERAGKTCHHEAEQEFHPLDCVHAAKLTGRIVHPVAAEMERRVVSRGRRRGCFPDTNCERPIEQLVQTVPLALSWGYLDKVTVNDSDGGGSRKLGNLGKWLPAESDG